jgi:hypothetical protein
MREYKRATRACSFSEFPDEIQTAFRKYAEKHGLGDVESGAFVCAETSSEKVKQGFFSKIFAPSNYAVKTCVVVTPERVLWATLDAKNQTAVLAARLRDVEIKDFSSSLIEDTGIEIFGLVGEFPERATAFVGLGEDAAAENLRRALKDAAEKAKR